MTEYDAVLNRLRATPATWVITGVAGFIGSNLLETLLRLDQRVVGVDNLSTGHERNLQQVRGLIGEGKWKGFTWVQGDIRDQAVCRRLMQGADYVLHQAALGSVPRSLEDPATTHDSNVTGSLNVLLAAKEAKVTRFVYASSSSVYGDSKDLPQVEDHLGQCLSPYAVSKRVNELYANVFTRAYNFPTIGLRYFNVFGPRQDPEGAYAAVIPRWIAAMIRHQPVRIFGDGSTSRDFCYVANVVQANILAATTGNAAADGQQFNIAVGEQTSLNQLFEALRRRLAKSYPHLESFRPSYGDFRPGDILHSRAEIGKACRYLGYQPTHRLDDGLDQALDWYKGRYSK